MTLASVRRFMGHQSTSVRVPAYAFQHDRPERPSVDAAVGTAADALTIGNACCGTIAIFLCLDYLASGNSRLLWYAFKLLPAALVCDVLDGIVARTLKRRQSVLGGDLDSLADVISFGVAPAVVGYTSACAAAGTCCA